MALTRAKNKTLDIAVDSIDDLPATGYEGQTIEVLNYWSDGTVGGGGTFVWYLKEGGSLGINYDPTSQHNGGTIFDPAKDAGDYEPNTESASTGCWVRQLNADEVTIKQFGGVGNYDADDTNALKAAMATGQMVYINEGIYKITDYIDTYVVSGTRGGLRGRQFGAGSAGSKYSILRFTGLTNTNKAAISVVGGSGKDEFYRIYDLYIQGAGNADDATEDGWYCKGFGLTITTPVDMQRCTVANFRRSNIVIHAQEPVSTEISAPYESRFTLVKSILSGGHGCVVGPVANVISFDSYQGKWSGCTSYGVKPTSSGDYDGMYVGSTRTANDYDPEYINATRSYTPESLVITGGDCSYNSRFGWNIDTTRNSGDINPGYAEGNIGDGVNPETEVRVGNVRNVTINFGSVQGDVDGFRNEQTYGAYRYTNIIKIGGKQVHPHNIYDMIKNPVAVDEVSGVIQNAPTRWFYTSRTNSEGSSTALKANSTPDGTAIDIDTETVLTIGGYASYTIGLGSGAHHAQYGNNYFRLPQYVQKKISSGWAADYRIEGLGTAAPTTGTWNKGDFIRNTSPGAVTTDTPFGWVCSTGGTPGTWYKVPVLDQADGLWMKAGSISWQFHPEVDGNFSMKAATSATPIFYFGNSSTGGCSVDIQNDLNVGGALSKGSGTFTIPHVLDSMRDTHNLVHSFVEGPRADLIYRGKVELIDGFATVNIDDASGMTDGTFAALNRDVQCFVNNNATWDKVRASVTGNVLTIECESQVNITVDWLVIGERQDDVIKSATWTDIEGRPIIEPLRVVDNVA